MTRNGSDVAAHMNWLAQQGCVICKRPAQLHHCGGGSMLARGVLKGKGSKNSDWLCLPLCEEHHTGRRGIHALGVQSWERRFGTQAAWLDVVGVQCGLDLYAMAHPAPAIDMEASWQLSRASSKASTS